jgi:1-deoxy-D-xylulose-5-phosphate synthase
VDGHDVHRLISTLRDLKDLKGPVFLHVITAKGHGYEPAQKDPSAYHGVSGPKKAAEPALVSASAPQPPPDTRPCHKHFGETLVSLAKADPRIVAITAAMPAGTGLALFAAEIPDRFYDVGICEQHAMALAGGLAAGGALPVAAIYSTFLQRAYDQVVHDVALQSAHVVVCMDRAGIVGGDGATANGAFDIAYLRTVPRTTLLAPADLPEMERMLRFALAHEGLVALRWPRANFRVAPLPGNAGPIELGRSARLREGEDLAIVAYGAVVPAALEAAEQLRSAGLEATVVNARFGKPLDVRALEDLAARHPLLVTVEDHALAGGFGSAVLESLGGRGRVVRIGLPDRFVEHGSRDDLLKRYGLAAAQIAERCEAASGAVK